MTHDLLSDMLEQLGAHDRPHHGHRAAREHLLRADHRRSRTGRRSRSTRGRPTRSRSRSAPRRRSSPHDRVIEESAIEFEGDEVNEEQLEAEVSRFRNFLEDVTPDQFVVEDEERLAGLAQHRDGERDAVEERVHEHPREDALRSVAQPGERDAERDRARAPPRRGRARARRRRRPAGSTASGRGSRAATGRRRGRSAPRRTARRRRRGRQFAAKAPACAGSQCVGRHPLLLAGALRAAAGRRRPPPRGRLRRSTPPASAERPTPAPGRPEREQVEAVDAISSTMPSQTA